MGKLRYSIIYAVIRPEISERLSVGIIIMDDTSIDIRYSEKKLKAVELLCSKPEYEFIGRTVRTLKKGNVIKSVNDIDYLSRYSNNLINISSLQTLDIDANEKNKNWLFKSYVCA